MGLADNIRTAKNMENRGLFVRERLGLHTLTNEISIGLYRNMIDPVLISKTHSVSGKLSIAAELESYERIGKDCV